MRGFIVAANATGRTLPVRFLFCVSSKLLLWACCQDFGWRRSLTPTSASTVHWQPTLLTTWQTWDFAIAKDFDRSTRCRANLSSTKSLSRTITSLQKKSVRDITSDILQRACDTRWQVSRSKANISEKSYCRQCREKKGKAEWIHRLLMAAYNPSLRGPCHCG
jgi:hypothetical protein